MDVMWLLILIGIVLSTLVSSRRDRRPEVADHVPAPPADRSGAVTNERGVRPLV